MVKHFSLQQGNGYVGTVTGLPAGVTASWVSNTITIGGTPTAGTFNYSIPLTGLWQCHCCRNDNCKFCSDYYNSLVNQLDYEIVKL
jgi:hypothetical protein